MFDPESVERKEGMTWDLSEHGGRECVLATDYDQLLERYKIVYRAFKSVCRLDRDQKEGENNPLAGYHDAAIEINKILREPEPRPENGQKEKP